MPVGSQWVVPMAHCSTLPPSVQGRMRVANAIDYVDPTIHSDAARERQPFAGALDAAGRSATRASATQRQIVTERFFAAGVFIGAAFDAMACRSRGQRYCADQMVTAAPTERAPTIH
jgi:hypothetical protein